MSQLTTTDSQQSEGTQSIVEAVAKQVSIAEECIQKASTADTFRNWKHEMTHLLYQLDPGREESRPALDKLFEFTAEESVAAKCPAYFDRIYSAIISFNFKGLTAAELDRPFRWKPESLCSESLCEMLEQHDFARIKYAGFGRVETPREYLALLVKNEVEIFVGLSEDELAPLLSEINQESVKSVEPKPLQSGLFVDVDGTLIKDGALDPEVLESMDAFRKKGIAVTVISAESPDAQTEKLLELGCSENYLPVRSKDNLKDVELEYLIDDTPPEHQGLNAVNYLGASGKGV